METELLNLGLGEPQSACDNLPKTLISNVPFFSASIVLGEHG